MDAEAAGAGESRVFGGGGNGGGGRGGGLGGGPGGASSLRDRHATRKYIEPVLMVQLTRRRDNGMCAMTVHGTFEHTARATVYW